MKHYQDIPRDIFAGTYSRRIFLQRSSRGLIGVGAALYLPDWLVRSNRPKFAFGSASQTLSPVAGSNTDQINNAISAVSSAGGGTVYLNPGTYECEKQIELTPPNPVELRSVNSASKAIIKRPGADGSGVHSYYCDPFVGPTHPYYCGTGRDEKKECMVLIGNGCALTDLIIHGPGVPLSGTPAHNRPIGVNSGGNPGAPISFQVYGCEIRNCPYSGINTGDYVDATIVGNSIHHNNDAGIQIGTASNFGTIQSNEVYSNGRNGSIVPAVTTTSPIMFATLMGTPLAKASIRIRMQMESTFTDRTTTLFGTTCTAIIVFKTGSTVSRSSMGRAIRCFF